MVTSYHAHKDKQKLQGKSGTEIRCCDTLVWGYFSPQECEALCGEDRMCICLCPYAPWSPARTSHLQSHSLSLSRKPCAALHVKLGERQQQEATALHCSQERGPQQSPTCTNTDLPSWGSALCTCPWLSPRQAGRECKPWLCPVTWCDRSCSLCKATFLLHGVVLLQGDTLGFFPIPLSYLESIAPDRHRYY